LIKAIPSRQQAVCVLLGLNPPYGIPLRTGDTLPRNGCNDRLGCFSLSAAHASQIMAQMAQISAVKLESRLINAVQIFCRSLENPGVGVTKYGHPKDAAG
jgi:hypothetical protein